MNPLIGYSGGFQFTGRGESIHSYMQFERPENSNFAPRFPDMRTLIIPIKIKLILHGVIFDISAL